MKSIGFFLIFCIVVDKSGNEMRGDEVENRVDVRIQDSGFRRGSSSGFTGHDGCNGGAIRGHILVATYIWITIHTTANKIDGRM